MTLEQKNKLHSIIHSKASKMDRILQIQQLIDEINKESFDAGKAMVRNGDLE